MSFLSSLGDVVKDVGSVFSPAAGLLSSGLDVWKMGRQSDEASFARDWEERMSNTAYQRATADMRKAGINPMVAYSQGGAAVPGAPVGQVGDVRNPVTSGLEIKQLNKQLEVLEEQRRKTASEADKANWDSASASFDADVKQWTRDAIGSNYQSFSDSILAGYRRAVSEANSAKSLSYLTEAQVPAAKAEADFWAKLGEGGGGVKGLGEFGKVILPILKMLKGSGGITINR